LGILLLGVAIIFGFSTGDKPLFVSATPPQESSDVLRISIEEAKQAFENGEAIFVDVRDPESFVAGHISGAVSIPLTELPDRLDELSMNALIIPY
jgi:3-mercaptopyruvate sulfurtransferase SseA